mmetsp:Transcript_3508/g.5066  ORF Transcript_3508/g.5066 Transcript_3508/m.5066 type:complete len:365 (-) Transcript_3508:50-1144(-)
MEEFNAAVQFWEGLSSEHKRFVFKNDPVFRYFDVFSILEIAEGKLLKFDVEKIALLQDKVLEYAADPENLDQGVRDVFAPKATKNLNVRSHKLVKIIKDRLQELYTSGDVPSPRGMEEEESNPALRMSPSNESGSSSDNSEDFVPHEPRYLCLSSALPEGARINIRSSPQTDGDVVTTIDSSSRVLAVGMIGHWAKVQSNEYGDAWVLTNTGNLQLLVDAGESVTPEFAQEVAEQEDARAPVPEPVPEPPRKEVVQVQHERGADVPLASGHEYPLHDPYAPPRTPIHPHPPSHHTGLQTPHLPSTFRDPVLTPGAPNEDPNRTVSLAEHNRLRYKVAQLEADMRALRLLLRSWSLDQPQHPAPY